jgi:hypothetical protein
MNLGEIYKFVNYVLNKEDNGEPYTPVQFNNVIPVVIQEVFNDLIKTYEKDRTSTGQIAPYRVSMGNATSPLTIDANGMATKPSDYYRSSSFVYKWSENGEIKYARVSELTDDQFATRKGMSSLKPDREHPICTDRNTYFEFLPKDLQYVDFVYIKLPETPHYGFYIDWYGDTVFIPESTSHTLQAAPVGSGLQDEVGENEEAPPTVVQSTTVELVMTTDLHPTIIFKLLVKAGMRLEKAEIVRAEIMEQQQSKQP